MILILNAFITDNRSRGNRYNRLDVFRYSLYSYRNIPFEKIFIIFELDHNYINQKDNLLLFIYNIFSTLGKDKIHVEFNRYYKQEHWNTLITNLYKEYGSDKLILFLNNDDHVFVDKDTKLLEEGIELLSKESNKHKTLYISHWPEIIKLSGKYNEPEIVGNFVKFNLTQLDSIQIFNLEYLFYILVTYKWKKDHPRIDDIIDEMTSTPNENNILSQTIYAPLKELFRKFDGYSHVNMVQHCCPPLDFPYNKFNYDRETLINKMTAPHNSPWTRNNYFNIPKEWIDINISLHDTSSYELQFMF